jgi:hypothetical protein
MKTGFLPAQKLSGVRHADGCAVEACAAHPVSAVRFRLKATTLFNSFVE